MFLWQCSCYFALSFFLLCDDFYIIICVLLSQGDVVLYETFFHPPEVVDKQMDADTVYPVPEAEFQRQQSALAGLQEKQKKQKVDGAHQRANAGDDDDDDEQSWCDRLLCRKTKNKSGASGGSAASDADEAGSEEPVFAPDPLNNRWGLSISPDASFLAIMGERTVQIRERALHFASLQLTLPVPAYDSGPRPVAWSLSSDLVAVAVGTLSINVYDIPSNGRLLYSLDVQHEHKDIGLNKGAPHPASSSSLTPLETPCIVHLGFSEAKCSGSTACERCPVLLAFVSTGHIHQVHVPPFPKSAVSQGSTSSNFVRHCELCPAHASHAALQTINSSSSAQAPTSTQNTMGVRNRKRQASFEAPASAPEDYGTVSLASLLPDLDSNVQYTAFSLHIASQQLCIATTSQQRTQLHLLRLEQDRGEPTWRVERSTDTSACGKEIRLLCGSDYAVLLDGKGFAHAWRFQGSEGAAAMHVLPNARAVDVQWWADTSVGVPWLVLAQDDGTVVITDVRGGGVHNRLGEGRGETFVGQCKLSAHVLLESPGGMTEAAQPQAHPGVFVLECQNKYFRRRQIWSQLELEGELESDHYTRVLVQRCYRLVSIIQSSPKDALHHLVQSGQLAQASKIAARHQLSPDLVSKAKWNVHLLTVCARCADQSPTQLESLVQLGLEECLAHVADASFVFSACLATSHVNKSGAVLDLPPAVQMLLLKYALERTEDPDAVDAPADKYVLAGYRLLARSRLRRLDTQTHVHTHTRSHMNSVELEPGALVGLASAYAQAGELEALTVLLARHLDELWGEYTSILNGVPLATGVDRYAHLMPWVAEERETKAATHPDIAAVLQGQSLLKSWRHSVGVDKQDWAHDVVRIEGEAVLAGVGQVWRPALLHCFGVLEAKVALIDRCAFETSAAEEWYIERAKRVDCWTGLLSHAKAILEQGVVYLGQGLASRAEQLLESVTSLHAIVYEHDLALSLAEFVVLEPLGRFKLVLKNSTELSLEDDVRSKAMRILECGKGMTAAASPHTYSLVQQQVLAHFITDLSTRKGGLAKARALLQASSASRPVAKRLLSDNVLLVQTGLACAYNCAETGESILQALDDLYGCFPVDIAPEGGNSEVIVTLEARLDTLERHLTAARVLNRHRCPQTLSFLHNVEAYAQAHAEGKGAVAADKDEGKWGTLLQKCRLIVDGVSRKALQRHEKGGRSAASEGDWLTIADDLVVLQRLVFPFLSLKACYLSYCRTLLMAGQFRLCKRMLRYLGKCTPVYSKQQSKSDRSAELEDASLAEASRMVLNSVSGAAFSAFSSFVREEGPTATPSPAAEKTFVKEPLLTPQETETLVLEAAQEYVNGCAAGDSDTLMRALRCLDVLPLVEDAYADDYHAPSYAWDAERELCLALEQLNSYEDVFVIPYQVRTTPVEQRLKFVYLVMDKHYSTLQEVDVVALVTLLGCKASALQCEVRFRLAERLLAVGKVGTCAEICLSLLENERFLPAAGLCQRLLFEEGSSGDTDASWEGAHRRELMIGHCLWSAQDGDTLSVLLQRWRVLAENAVSIDGALTDGWTQRTNAILGTAMQPDEKTEGVHMLPSRSEYALLRTQRVGRDGDGEVGTTLATLVEVLIEFCTPSNTDTPDASVLLSLLLSVQDPVAAHKLVHGYLQQTENTAHSPKVRAKRSLLVEVSLRCFTQLAVQLQSVDREKELLYCDMLAVETAFYSLLNQSNAKQDEKLSVLLGLCQTYNDFRHVGSQDDHLLRLCPGVQVTQFNTDPAYRRFCLQNLAEEGGKNNMKAVRELSEQYKQPLHPILLARSGKLMAAFLSEDPVEFGGPNKARLELQGYVDTGALLDSSEHARQTQALFMEAAAGVAGTDTQRLLQVYEWADVCSSVSGEDHGRIAAHVACLRQLVDAVLDPPLDFWVLLGGDAAEAVDAVVDVMDASNVHALAAAAEELRLHINPTTTLSGSMLFMMFIEESLNEVLCEMDARAEREPLERWFAEQQENLARVSKAHVLEIFARELEMFLTLFATSHARNAQEISVDGCNDHLRVDVGALFPALVLSKYIVARAEELLSAQESKEGLGTIEHTEEANAEYKVDFLTLKRWVNVCDCLRDCSGLLVPATLFTSESEMTQQQKEVAMREAVGVFLVQQLRQGFADAVLHLMDNALLPCALLRNKDDVVAVVLARALANPAVSKDQAFAATFVSVFERSDLLISMQTSVLLEMYFPGCQAQLNGEESPALADLLLVCTGAADEHHPVSISRQQWQALVEYIQAVEEQVRLGQYLAETPDSLEAAWVSLLVSGVAHACPAICHAEMHRVSHSNSALRRVQHAVEEQSSASWAAVLGVRVGLLLGEASAMRTFLELWSVAAVDVDMGWGQSVWRWMECVPSAMERLKLAQQPEEDGFGPREDDGFLSASDSEEGDGDGDTKKRELKDAAQEAKIGKRQQKIHLSQLRLVERIVGDSALFRACLPAREGGGELALGQVDVLSLLVRHRCYSAAVDVFITLAGLPRTSALASLPKTLEALALFLEQQQLVEAAKVLRKDYK
jgi:hypothetical protein